MAHRLPCHHRKETTAKEGPGDGEDHATAVGRSLEKGARPRPGRAGVVPGDRRAGSRPVPQQGGPVMKRERGSGSLFQDSYRDKQTGELVKCRTWTMKLWVGGKALKKSSGTTSRSVALKRLDKWKADVLQGTYVPGADKTTFDDGATLLTNEYKANGRRSADRVEDANDHLRAFFGGYCRMRAITTDRVLPYVRHRQEQGAANATINRELSALKRMFRLGERAGKVARRPHVDMLHEANARKGFFEPDAFEAMLSHLPEYLRPVFATAYITGWRVKSEILTRQKCHLDLKAGWLRLEPNETKSGEGRQFPLTSALPLRTRPVGADPSPSRPHAVGFI